MGIHPFKAMAKASTSRVKVVSSSEAAARDEGPRLIPLRNEPRELPMSHYLHLADVALMGSAKDDRKSGYRKKKGASGSAG
jgi:hypothetical protein